MVYLYSDISRTLKHYEAPPNTKSYPHILQLPGDICARCQLYRAEMLKTLGPVITFAKPKYDNDIGRSSGVAVDMEFHGGKVADMAWLE